MDPHGSRLGEKARPSPMAPTQPGGPFQRSSPTRCGVAAHLQVGRGRVYTLPRANASGRRGSRAVRGSGGRDGGGEGRATARRGKRTERVNTATTFVRATTRYYLADNSVIEGHAVCP